MADGQQSMTDEDIRIREMFEMFDADKSGAISQDELGTVMRALDQNPTKEDLEEMIKAVDKNENGMIEFEEFKKMYAKNAKTKEENKNDLAEAFSRFDKEGNGYISKEQLAKALGDGFDIEEMFSNADVNSDGKISYQEFVDLWSSL